MTVIIYIQFYFMFYIFPNGDSVIKLKLKIPELNNVSYGRMPNQV